VASTAGWVARPTRARSNKMLGAKVRARFIASYRIYAARRVWHDVQAAGQQCGLHYFERLMHLQALKARPRWRVLPQNDGRRPVIAENVLDRQISAEAPTRKRL